jgi:hypothetical protein
MKPRSAIAEMQTRKKRQVRNMCTLHGLHYEIDRIENYKPKFKMSGTTSLHP